ncbi:CP17A-like protein [Mya arenaria]|uniref:CP17A-like protein n=1 Tax=Mya arenaria TaxID=6604 RepID=A0ABY7DZ96_MYAAR|nr:steroid 17-alpha-hydroxylase/17,20 lyase-like isoform X3 [Mya arenaria]WAR03067.1 CP17A-like protein [Mya arenaria]
MMTSSVCRKLSVLHNVRVKHRTALSAREKSVDRNGIADTVRTHQKYVVDGSTHLSSSHVDRKRLHIQGLEWSRIKGPVVRIQILWKKIILLSDSLLLRGLLDNESDGGRTCNHRPRTTCGDVITHSIAFSTNFQFSRVQKLKLLEISNSTENKAVQASSADLAIYSLTNVLSSCAGRDVNPTNAFLGEYLQNMLSIQLIGVTLPPEDPDHDVLWEFIDHLYALIDPAVDAALRTFPFLRLLPGYYGDLYRQTIAARDRVAKRFFEDQKASYRPGVVRGLVDVCLINQQAEITRTGTSWLTDEHIKGLIYDTLAAGMTELLKSLRLFLLLMCHHPEVQARIQTEVDTVIGSDRFPKAGDRMWMPYTEAVMLEVWRYGSQTPLAIPHLCRKDVVLEEYLIEAGTVIFPNLYAVHHDEAVWGDPWNFRPERFLDAKGNLLPTEHVFMLNVIPFGVGKRACPGQDFARSRIFITVAALIQRMRIEPPENSELPSPDPRLYTKNYPMNEPQFQCRFLARGDVFV